MQGRQLGLSPLQTKMGLAIAEDPLGPFTNTRAIPRSTAVAKFAYGLIAKALRQLSRR